MAREYLLTKIEHKFGTKNQNSIYDIHWFDLTDSELYVTIVDESYRNFVRSNWNQMVYGDTPYGIYTGLVRTARRTRDGTLVISADSHPQQLMPLTRDEMIAILEWKLKELETHANSSIGNTTHHHAS